MLVCQGHHGGLDKHTPSHGRLGSSRKLTYTILHSKLLLLVFPASSWFLWTRRHHNSLWRCIKLRDLGRAQVASTSSCAFDNSHPIVAIPRPTCQSWLRTRAYESLK